MFFGAVGEHSAGDHVATSAEPFSALQVLDALSISLNTIVKHATREPEPLVLRCRSRTVANVDSIGLVVRM